MGNKASIKFAAIVDFIEGPSILNEMFKGRLIESVEDLNTMLAMLEVGAPVDAKGYRKAYFFVTIADVTEQVRFDLQCDTSEDRRAKVAAIADLLSAQ